MKFPKKLKPKVLLAFVTTLNKINVFIKMSRKLYYLEEKSTFSLNSSAGVAKPMPDIAAQNSFTISAFEPVCVFSQVSNIC